jgi:hypothetical protein
MSRTRRAGSDPRRSSVVRLCHTPSGPCPPGVLHHGRSSRAGLLEYIMCKTHSI